MGASRGNTWKSGIVPYRVDPNFTPVNNLNAAFAAWESVTNLRFLRRLSPQRDYISVQHTAQACFSRVGRQGGKQIVGCAPFGFGVAALTHELGHAVSMIHEHQRSDRNNFVTIQGGLIQAGRGGNFTLITNSNNGAVYDFRSLMHYRANAFAIDRRPTIVPVVAGTLLNLSNAPTAQDVAFINALYPVLGVVRRSDSTGAGAGRVRELSTISFGGGNTSRLMTAVRTSSGRLRLIEWRVSTLGGVARIADSGIQAGTARHIDISHSTRSAIFVTACRIRSGRLRLISWEARRGGINRRGDSGNQAGAATQIKVEALTNTHYVSACRTRRGILRLISWRRNRSGSLTRLADSANQGGAVSQIAMSLVSSAGNNHIVATTVRRPNGRLRVITWHVRSDTGAITRRGDSGNTIGVASAIDTTMAPTGHLLVSCKTRRRRLRVIAFSINAAGTTITRRGDSGNQAGRIGKNAIAARPYGAISSVSMANGKFRLIKWSVSAGGQITRAGDSGDQAGNVGLVDVVTLSAVPNAPVVAPVKTGSGRLMLLSWDDLSATGELQR